MGMTLDRTLAFTALLEQDKTFRGLSMQEEADRISALLKDWYTETGGERNMWDYTREWLAREATTTRQEQETGSTT